MSTNGNVKTEPADLFARVKIAHDLQDRLYRIVDDDIAILMVLIEAAPDGLAALEAFISRVERKSQVLGAIQTLGLTHRVRAETA